MKTTKIAKVFANCRREGRAALMPFVTAGYPSIEEFVPLVESLSAGGADMIEVGFPHSDPLADGPVIQHASHLALENGFTVEKGFAAIQAATMRIAQPIVVMCYANVVLRRGVEKFVKQCEASGVSGLIVPDMILEESASVRAECRKHGIDFVPLVTLT
ncbi:MAG: tryptophan synthase subunit alpha, partial [Candidatus Zixiibacteriota bacterium]